MLAFIIIVALIVLYFIAQEALRNSGLLCMLTLFGVVPFTLTVFWFQYEDLDLFLWIKLYTILFCICWGSWLRFTSHGTSRWFLTTISLLLAANILEAMSMDFLGSGLAHGLNVLSGLMLLVSLPYGASCVRIDIVNKHHDLRFDNCLTWIVGYTLWNWSFTYLNYTSLVGHHTAILAVALIVAIVDPQRWLQTRAATLGVSLIFTAISYSGMLSVIDTNNWYEEHIAILVASFALGWTAVHTIQFRVASLKQHFAGRQLIFVPSPADGRVAC